MSEFTFIIVPCHVTYLDPLLKYTATLEPVMQLNPCRRAVIQGADKATGKTTALAPAVSVVLKDSERKSKVI